MGFKANNTPWILPSRILTKKENYNEENPQAADRKVFLDGRQFIGRILFPTIHWQREYYRTNK